MDMEDQAMGEPRPSRRVVLRTGAVAAGALISAATAPGLYAFPAASSGEALPVLAELQFPPGTLSPEARGAVMTRVTNLLARVLDLRPDALPLVIVLVTDGPEDPAEAPERAEPAAV